MGLPARRLVTGLLSAAVAVTFPTGAQAQETGVSGHVRSQGRPLDGAQIEAWSGETLLRRAGTDAAGAYRLRLDAGEYAIVFRSPGYAVRRVGLTVPGAGFATLDVELDIQPFQLENLNVTALRATGRATDAPVSVTVIDEHRISERNAVSAMDHALGVPGVDVAVQGLQSRQVVARGFNQTFGPFLLVMTDYRNASIPSLRGNLSQFIPAVDADIDRIEIVRGPASALYGPNAADGIVHFITKSPFDSPGTTASVTAGGQSLIHVTGRHAQPLGERAAFKVSAQYLRGDEFPVEPHAAELTARDPVVERAAGEGRMDLRVSDTGTAILTLASTLAIRHVEYTGLGASQIKDWRYDFAQLRYTDRGFFAQAYVNRNDAGKSFNLRTLDRVVDRSNVAVAQVQQRARLGDARLTAGVDAQRTEPRTAGTISGRNEADDVSVELGAYVQAELDVGRDLELLGSGRVDRHNRLPDPVFSPRVGVLYTAAPGHRLRASYNRAFSTPTSTDLFVDLLASRLDPLPFGLRALGVPQSGSRFLRDCDGPCMRSPFAPGVTLPLDATILWPAVVQILQAQGVDLSALPPPGAGEVGTVLRILDPNAGVFRPYVAELADLAPLGPTITNAVELGYRGLIRQRLLVDAALHYTRRNNFRGPLAIETPNAFLSTTDLAAYLGRFMSAPQAQALAAGIGGIDSSAEVTGIPLATVALDNPLAGSDILLTYRNFGEVSLWGVDAAAELLIGSRVSVSGTYSYLSDNYFPGALGATDLALNAPRHKGAFSLKYDDQARGRSAELRGRLVGSFRMVDGVWLGTVPGHGVLDAEAGLDVPHLPGARLSLTLRNLTGNRHAEFVGAPMLGRLLLTRLSYRF